jgi:phosphatidylglycerol:prolipoprotein diacylglycerol transferase
MIVPPLAYWVHQPHPFLIQFSENFGIRFYGLAYLAGFLIAGWLLRRYHQAGRSALDANAIFDLMTWLVAGVVIGGRLGYFLLYQPELVVRDPLALIRVWEGGMASHGGFVGVILAMWLFARRRKIPFLPLTDLVVSTVPVGLFFGRVANFINGELWGKPATVPWAVIFEKTGGGALPRHPSQLYEAALEGLLLFAYVQWRFWKSDCTQRQPGRLAGEFLVGYALLRIFGERFREPDAGVELLYGLSRGTFYSLFVLAGGLAVVAFTRRRNSQRKA